MDTQTQNGGSSAAIGMMMEAQSRALLENLSEGVVACDAEGKLSLFNRVAREWHGCDPLSIPPEQWAAQYDLCQADGLTPLPTDQIPLLRAFRGEPVHNFEFSIVRPGLPARHVLASGTAMLDPHGQKCGAVVVMNDITERRKVEQQALRSQRLESLGTLAGGIAHDLNNALAPILLSLETLRDKYPEDSKLLEICHNSARRGSEMVKQLLTFAHGSQGERAPVPPAMLVTEMRKMIRGSFPKNIKLVVKCEEDIPFLLGDATQLHQVLLNLCVNARDAMPNGGTLTLEAAPREVDALFASTCPEARPGSYIVLRVSDTGTGIPPEILDHIFDPFFTTKGPEKGTGLGLSTVMGIVKAHQGFLQVQSQVGNGTTFNIFLPATRTAPAGATAVKREDYHGAGETVLLVDDEVCVREMARTVLKKLNFKPLTASDGVDGLLLAMEHRKEIRAVITDLHMPHMDGLAFVRALRRMLPNVPVIISTGRMEELLTAEFKVLEADNRLDKPFSQRQLADMLKDIVLLE